MSNINSQTEKLPPAGPGGDTPTHTAQVRPTGSWGWRPKRLPSQYTTREVADALGVSMEQLRALMKTHGLGRRLPSSTGKRGQWRIDAADYERLLRLIG